MAPDEGLGLGMHVCASNLMSRGHFLVSGLNPWARLNGDEEGYLTGSAVTMSKINDIIDIIDRSCTFFSIVPTSHQKLHL